MLWNYYTAQIFLFGAELTKAYAIRRGSGIIPSVLAEAVTPDARSQQGLAPTPTMIDDQTHSSRLRT